MKKNPPSKKTGKPKDGRQRCGNCKKNVTKCKCGRPQVVTEKTREILVQACHESFTVQDACKFAGIAEKTYYNECKRNPAFLQEMNLAQLWAEKLIRSNIVKTATYDARIGLAYLERKRKAEWSPRLETSNEHTIQLKPISERTLETIKRFNGGQTPAFSRATQKLLTYSEEGEFESEEG